MKILLTGGGTGGHYFPIVAVIEALRDIERESNLVDVNLHYAGDAPYGERFFYEHQVEVKKINTGKRRQYFSLLNILDLFKTFFALFSTLWYMYWLFPDVVFSKGGSVSFPVLFAARILRIPVMIHESDSSPGRTNIWASKFAKSIAISYPEAAEHFPKEKTVLTGNPLRKDVLYPVQEGAKEFLQLEEDIPIITILGGSQGAMKINDTILEALPELLEKYQVIHQVGEKNVDSIENLLGGVLANSDKRHRYKYFGRLNNLAMKMTAGASDIIISRAGSTIFEIAAWGLPSLIIPIKESNGNHQVKNAYYYARAGAAEVIEEENLSPHLLATEIERIIKNPEAMEKMSLSAEEFAVKDAARNIARQLIELSYHRKTEDSKEDESEDNKEQENAS